MSVQDDPTTASRSEGKILKFNVTSLEDKFLFFYVRKREPL